MSEKQTKRGRKQAWELVKQMAERGAPMPTRREFKRLARSIARRGKP